MSNGFDDLSKKLKKMSDGLSALDGNNQVPITDLLTDTFVSKNTNHSSAQQLFDKSGFKIESAEDFSAIPDDEWDSYINGCSSFENWSEMLEAATGEYVSAKMGLG